MSHSAKAEQPISLEALKKQRKPLVNVNEQFTENLTPLEKLAIFISDHVGTPGFFFLVLLWTVFWLSWNLLAPDKMKFDQPMAFVFWLFISNMLQIFLMPLIMVAQNLQDRHSELRAQHDFDVNVKAEREIEVILRHLEYQNSLLLALMEKNGLQADQLLHSVPKPADPGAADADGEKTVKEK